MSGVQFKVGICLAASHFHGGVFPSIHLRIRSDLQGGQDRHSCARVSGLQFIARSAAISECSPTIPVQLHFARPETEDAHTKSMSTFETDEHLQGTAYPFSSCPHEEKAPHGGHGAFCGSPRNR